uniref:Uncharacterized protein n=1 Tax=Rhizophora mucronata TaxID=61149 RepID=A0A2P2N985_RHIMU
MLEPKGSHYSSLYANEYDQ